MSLRDVNIKTSYETLKEDPVEEFYIPVLKESVTYDRIAGFFSSASLALAARGICGLIENGGRMRLIVSPNLSAEDLGAIRGSSENPELYIEQAMIDSLEELGDTLEHDHVRALGWMLAKGLLEIRIVCVVTDDKETMGSLFHQKVGVLRDAEGNEVSFSGSINETASGWLSNVEEFKVFNSWTPGHETYLVSDAEKFEEFWCGKRAYARAFEPSEAFAKRIMRLGEGFTLERIRLREYKKERSRKKARELIPLFPYQAEAVEKWEKSGCRMLFEMATGTGKTRTAIACVNILKAAEERLVCVVAAPEITLVRQWEQEFETLGVQFDKVVYADGSSGGRKKWETEIGRALSRLRSGIDSSLLVLTTHATASNDTFTGLFAKVGPEISMCFVGDEVHGLGATKQRRALLDRYDQRIGLSATPSRWFDDGGTAVIEKYFNNECYVFGIRDAQQTIRPGTSHAFLTPYSYVPVFVSLNPAEMDEYAQLTERIAKLSHSDEDEHKSLLERLMMRRANITKNAEAKIETLSRIVEAEPVKNTIVFVSDQQIDEVLEVLSSCRVSAHAFTMKQGTRRSAEYGGRSEREYLIDQFKEGGYQALVAISCLDEGIDIPSADTAILLSSSTNPREYIQRIGRVIRYYENKEKATIYDFVVEPNWRKMLDQDSREYEKKIFGKELGRVEEMASNASNSFDVMQQVNRKLEVLYGV